MKIYQETQAQSPKLPTFTQKAHLIGKECLLLPPEGLQKLSHHQSATHLISFVASFSEPVFIRTLWFQVQQPIWTSKGSESGKMPYKGTRYLLQVLDSVVVTLQIGTQNTMVFLSFLPTSFFSLQTDLFPYLACRVENRWLNMFCFSCFLFPYGTDLERLCPDFIFLNMDWVSAVWISWPFRSNHLQWGWRPSRRFLMPLFWMWRRHPRSWWEWHWNAPKELTI